MFSWYSAGPWVWIFCSEILCNTLTTQTCLISIILFFNWNLYNNLLSYVKFDSSVQFPGCISRTFLMKHLAFVLCQICTCWVQMFLGCNVSYQVTNMCPICMVDFSVLMEMFRLTTCPSCECSFYCCWNCLHPNHLFTTAALQIFWDWPPSN